MKYLMAFGMRFICMAFPFYIGHVLGGEAFRGAMMFAGGVMYAWWLTKVGE